MTNDEHRKEWGHPRPTLGVYVSATIIILLLSYGANILEAPEAYVLIIMFIATWTLFLIFVISDVSIWSGLTKEYSIRYPRNFGEEESIEWFVENFKASFENLVERENRWYEYFLNLAGTLPYHFYQWDDSGSRVFIKLDPEVDRVRFTLLKGARMYRFEIDSFMGGIGK